MSDTTERVIHEETGASGENGQEARDGARCLPENGKVEKAIRDSVYASIGIGIVPIPFLNIAAVTASNLNLARGLSNLYGIGFKEGAANKIITSIIGAGAGTLAAPAIGTAVLGIPLIGFPLAIGTRSILNGMTTYALGRMFATHFERGGSFVGANVDVMTEDFKAAFKSSREWLANVIGGKKDHNAASA